MKTCIDLSEKKRYCIRSMSECGIPVIEIKGGELPTVDKTFDCGQCFRFERVENSRHESEWGGVAFGRYVSFAEENGSLYIYNSTEEDFYNIWYDFLDLGTDYSTIEKDILSKSENPALKRAVEFGRGIRILRQDKWEALCSFIISQNNNIPRIKKIVSSLCETMGEPIDTMNASSHGAAEISYAFPDAVTVAKQGVDALRELRTGFRAKYIDDAARRVGEGALVLDEISSMPTAFASERLCEIKGVGPKVAACTLLFGFGKYDAFPVDVWIKRAVEKYFSSEFDPKILGSYAGVAQQYLFYYERYLGGE
jgi:N-glycosylase/DNA lyase